VRLVTVTLDERRVTLGHPTGYLAADGRHLPLELAQSRFAGVLDDDVADRPSLSYRRFSAADPGLLHLLWAGCGAA
jgi:hypothetical protein